MHRQHHTPARELSPRTKRNLSGSLGVCTQDCRQGACTCAFAVIKTKPSLLTRVKRALLPRWLNWQADCVRAERQQYEDAGVVGPDYVRNSLLAELQLRVQARRLEQGRS